MRKILFIIISAISLTGLRAEDSSVQEQKLTQIQEKLRSSVADIVEALESYRGVKEEALNEAQEKIVDSAMIDIESALNLYIKKYELAGEDVKEARSSLRDSLMIFRAQSLDLKVEKLLATKSFWGESDTCPWKNLELANDSKVKIFDLFVGIWAKIISEGGHTGFDIEKFAKSMRQIEIPYGKKIDQLEALQKIRIYYSTVPLKELKAEIEHGITDLEIMKTAGKVQLSSIEIAPKVDEITEKMRGLKRLLQSQKH